MNARGIPFKMPRLRRRHLVGAKNHWRLGVHVAGEPSKQFTGDFRHPRSLIRSRCCVLRLGSCDSWFAEKDAEIALAAERRFHKVAAWREFMQRYGLEGDPAATDAESVLRARKLLAEAEERELRLAVKKREYVALTEFQECWTAQVARATDLLRHKFELELPPILSGLDAVAIQAECGKALDELSTLLHEPGGGVA